MFSEYVQKSQRQLLQKATAAVIQKTRKKQLYFSHIRATKLEQQTC